MLGRYGEKFVWEKNVSTSTNTRAVKYVPFVKTSSESLEGLGRNTYSKISASAGARAVGRKLLN